MNEPDARPTDEDFEAAREVLRHRLKSDGSEWDAMTEELLAYFHRRWGHDKFQLRFGLREPVTEDEQWDVEFFRKQISDDEFRQRMKTYVNRPVDLAMLKQFFAEKYKDLARYGQFHVAVGELLHRHVVDEFDEEKIDRLAGEMHAKWKMYKEEITSVIEFLQEARIEKRIGRASISEFAAATASELALAVTIRSRDYWQTCREMAGRNPYAKTATQRFANGLYQNLPSAQDVVTLIEEEFALARVYLRERLATTQAEGEPTGEELASTREEVLLTVEHWSEMAIGIDASWRYWATSPPPERGTPFKKSQAIELPLRGDRWQAVLKALAESPEPNRANLVDILRELDQLPPPATPGARQQAHADQLHSQDKGLRKSLNETLKDLNRKLRKLVPGPRGRGDSALSIKRDVVVCRFHVAFLLPDASGHVRFGDPPRS